MGRGIYLILISKIIPIRGKEMEVLYRKFFGKIFAVQ